MSISEALSRAATEGRTIQCPRTGQHGEKCMCRGTKLVKPCEDCKGAGFDGQRQQLCKKCNGQGAVAGLVETKIEFKIG